MLPHLLTPLKHNSATWRSSSTAATVTAVRQDGGYPTSGAEGNRTPDPFHAMEVLYQLSYSPERVQDDTSPQSKPAMD